MRVQTKSDNIKSDVAPAIRTCCLVGEPFFDALNMETMLASGKHYHHNIIREVRQTNRTCRVDVWKTLFRLYEGFSRIEDQFELISLNVGVG